MKIAVIGTGYVGLVTGTCLAESGNEVICIDKDARKIEMLKQGRLPIYEPGLLELVQRNRREGRLDFTTDLPAGVAPAQLIFIAVGTPQVGRRLRRSVHRVGRRRRPGCGHHRSEDRGHQEHRAGGHQPRRRRAAGRAHSTAIDVASNPEFLKEGAAIDDCMKPDRVVVGVRRPEVARCSTSCTPPFCAPNGRSWSCRRKAPR